MIRERRVYISSRVLGTSLSGVFIHPLSIDVGINIQKIKN